MGEWRTIWDHEFAEFGERSMSFPSPNGAYQVVVSHKDQDSIAVRHAGTELRWAIHTKAVCDRTFRLSGMTFGASALFGEEFWYELHLASPGVIMLWGNQVLARRDQEI